MVADAARAALTSSGFEQVVDSCPDAFLLHRNGTIVYANGIALALFRANGMDDLVGRSVFDLVPPSHRQELSARVQRISRGLANGRHRKQVVALDGSVVEVEVSAVPVELDGERLGAVVIRDIGEQIAMEREKAALAKMVEQNARIASLGRLAATVAHEFNNVMMSIQPYAEILQRKPEDVAVVQKSATAILQAMRRGSRIASEILRFARPVQPSLSRVNLNEWLGNFARDVAALNLANIEVRIEVPPAAVWVMADTGQLEQLVINLVVNARDAMPDGGRLTITCRMCNACLGSCDVLPSGDLSPFACVRVSDTGRGIPEDLLGKVFEPLFTTKRNGTGLGLAVSHQIATAHGGHLVVRSELGKGTSFYLLLRAAN